MGIVVSSGMRPLRINTSRADATNDESTTLIAALLSSDWAVAVTKDDNDDDDDDDEEGDEARFGEGEVLEE